MKGVMLVLIMGAAIAGIAAFAASPPRAAANTPTSLGAQ